TPTTTKPPSNTLECRPMFSVVAAMTTRRAWAIVSLAAIAAGFGQAAQAAQLGRYVGGSFGITARDFVKEPFDDILLNGFFPAVGIGQTPHECAFDAQIPGCTALIGYRITAHWAIEGMLIDLREIAYRETSTGVIDASEPFTVDTKFVWKATGIG